MNHYIISDNNSENIVDNDIFQILYRTKTTSDNSIYIFRFNDTEDDALYAVAISSEYYSIYKVENTFKDLLSNRIIYSGFINLNENDFNANVKDLFNDIDKQTYKLYDIYYYIA